MKVFLIILALFFSGSILADGNPRPGYPHDTLIFHVKKAASGSVDCSGMGHAAFVRYDELTSAIVPVDIFIYMIDWVPVDNDGDGFIDEDPANGIDDDFDGLVDEDGPEAGAKTGFSDCDGLDGSIALMIRDTDPAAGRISTQEWFIRGIGKPEENFAFYTHVEQATCTVVEDPDGEPNSGDEVLECSFDDDGWIALGHVSTAGYDSDQDGTIDQVCVKQVKLRGKNSSKGGGNTAFCDITGEFLVDVDEDGDGIVDLVDQFVFAFTCPDDPDTLVDESLACPLARIIWQVDENDTTSKAKAQVFISHTGSAQIKGGKIKGRSQ